MQLKQIFAAAGLLAATFFALSAGAQTSCAEDDLKCRVAALEARLDAMSGKVETAQATANQAVATATTAAAAVPNKIFVRRFCKVSCAEEAVDECKKRGFSDGKADDWERPKTGPVTLTRISCTK